MGVIGRPGLSDSQKAELWRRWRCGQSLVEIGLALERHANTIASLIGARGGFAPAERRRSARSLNLGEREEISRGLASGLTLRSIAGRLRRAPSSISREVASHGGRLGYRAAQAEAAAWDRGRRPKPCRLAGNPALRQLVSDKLLAQWSPQQISGWLKREHGRNGAMQVSHETIYKSLFIQSRGVLKKELVAHLRSKRHFRRASAAAGQPSLRGRIADAVSISQRPAQIEDRAVPGHWEGDLLSGGGNSHIATLVERQSRFVMLVRITGKDTTTVVDALVRQVQLLPQGMMASLTWDRGMELAHHKRFTIATNVSVYFCDPQSPWQRGSNENTNGLLRQYFPKGSDLSRYTQLQLDDVALRLNTRPRKTLAFMTPAEKLAQAVATTA